MVRAVYSVLRALLNVSELCGSSFVECVSSFLECVCVLEGEGGGVLCIFTTLGKFVAT